MGCLLSIRLIVRVAGTLLGEHPVPLFSFNTDAPCLLAPGDEVQFEPISLPELERIEKAVASGEWVASNEALQ